METRIMKLYINEEHRIGHINPEIYGHFSEHLGRCIYEGIYVGEDSQIPNQKGMRTDVVEALKEIQLPVLRWPGGCFADAYHWRDGIGPKSERKAMLNNHWGGVLDDNSFGTHEFFELCEQLGCKTYINGNLGSGTVQEMYEWVEYMTFDGNSPMARLRQKNGREQPWQVDYFGVGNESWGCGGNMTPQHYANEYRRYQTYVRQFNKDHQLQKICCGANAFDYRWTKKVLETCTEGINYPVMSGLSLHYYTVPRTATGKGSATKFGRDEYYQVLSETLKMEELIKGHSAIMDQFDPEQKIGMIIDEWGTWYDVEPGTNPGFLFQQNTMRDALVAGINLNLFNKYCNRVKMANLAQVVNVLQAVILTEGPAMVKTPTWYVFHMYKEHQDGELLDSCLADNGELVHEAFRVPEVHESVSLTKSGEILITLNNLSDADSKTVEMIFAHLQPEQVQGRVLTGAINGFNGFDEGETIREMEFQDFELTPDHHVKVNLPPCSVVALKVR